MRYTTHKSKPTRTATRSINSDVLAIKRASSIYGLTNYASRLTGPELRKAWKAASIKTKGLE